MEKFTVTLADLRKAGACVSGYNKVVRALQGKEFTEADENRESYIRFAHKEPIGIRAILDSNGLDDALWALRCIDNAENDKDVRLFGVWCARQVQHMMGDQRSLDALGVAERYANGLATEPETDAARAAAQTAAQAAAFGARDAAWAAAFTAQAAAWTAAQAAAFAAHDAAWNAAQAAALDAAWTAAQDAALDAALDARGAARDAQKDMLIKMLEGNAPWQNKGDQS